MSEANNTEFVTITVDGQEVQAPKGAMLIEVTDAQNIKVPRFCYHKKLAVAANCRMCLVEVEKAPKPLPACATPVMDGMIVHTQSKYAKDAQKSVMEFLLINHPLDCPICDQGGECELQDVAVAYGQSVSEYTETKRVAFDKNIGPLITTELTRCIHCTRCVRFGREIAGIRELGMTGRGENALISTFIDECINSEMSGNSIDVCPVGALTAKPSRFKGRAWEMIQHKTIAPHDCIGSNLSVHTLRGEIVRVVPCENETINEVWISDRDRFSYEGVESDDRLTTPMIKRDGKWQAADWDEALKVVADKFKTIADEKVKQIEAAAKDEEAEVSETEAEDSETVEPINIEMAALISANATLEEQYLTQKLMRVLGSGNIDFRLRQSDFSDQDAAPVMPWLGQSIEQLEKLDAALLIGSNVRKEQPIANLRLRKATVNNDAKISFINPRIYDFNYDVANNIAVAQQNMVAELAAVAAATYQLSGGSVPVNLADAVSSANVSDSHKAIAQQLKDAESATVLIGNIANMHPQLSALRALAEAIAKETNSAFGYLTDGCNAAGAWLAGAVPHRAAGGTTEDVVAGKNISELTSEKLAACLLLNIEPDTDAADANALMAMLDNANFVVSISAYNSASVKQVADVMLPAANFMETSGTYVNAEGFWQSFKGVLEPKGGARPAWKILRVLGNLAGVDGFEHMSSEEVKAEVRSHCEHIELSNVLDSSVSVAANATTDLHRSSDVPMYSTDAIVRRASSLQKTVDAQTMCVRLNSAEADRLGVAEVSTVVVKQGENSASLSLVIDDTIPDASAWIPLAVEGNEVLGSAFGVVAIEGVQS
ncbi:NADH-ubiquinone oxidoreductase chain G [hydrothermal vent metagenome]|uniref:NADH-ubiquinone oxidoreductase chain G n=1 Tax=hydrothermal vent metagenome TaxID=652676 RepID=A0A3B0W6M5_9ZZZZ